MSHTRHPVSGHVSRHGPEHQRTHDETLAHEHANRPHHYNGAHGFMHENECGSNRLPRERDTTYVQDQTPVSERALTVDHTFSSKRKPPRFKHKVKLPGVEF